MVENAPSSNLTALVQCTSNEVNATLTDRRPEGLSVFGDLNDEQRVDLACEAWRIGLRALGNAHVAAQESRLKDIGTALVTEIDQQLQSYVEQQQEAIVDALARFFDPKDGQVSQRLADFVDDQGVLARLLDKYVGPKNSVLAEVMARQIGDSSPLFKKLSTTDSEGLVKILERQLGQVMSESRSELIRALDPLAEEGAVARFLRSLREELKGAEQGRAEQLSAALAALDANNEASLLSRLVRETSQARVDVLEAMNPHAPHSPMAILTTSVTRLLKEQASAESDRAAAQQERQAAFEKEVREALVRIETKRAHGHSSTRGGLDFEDSVIAFVRNATAAGPCVLDVTGATAGVGRCKKGDAVLRFTSESAFAGMAVVFEAKHDATFTVQRALDELDAARKNRDAVAGVFIMARSHASEAFPAFARYGSNVLVTWDDEDRTTDAYLHAAVLLGMGLVVRSKPTGDAGDISALRDVASRLEAELSRLERMEKCSDSIRKNVDGLDDELRRARKAFDLLVRRAQSTLQALNVECRDESLERGSPIVASAGLLTPGSETPAGGEQDAA